jgi:hypothetical protein
MGVQTDDGGADCVPVHLVPRVVSHRFVRTPRRHFVGAAVHVHTGKDGRVHQLCGPRITTLQGHAKKVLVQQRKVPARIEKKKVSGSCLRRGDLHRIACWIRSASSGDVLRVIGRFLFG